VLFGFSKFCTEHDDATKTLTQGYKQFTKIYKSYKNSMLQEGDIIYNDFQTESPNVLGAAVRKFILHRRSGPRDLPTTVLTLLNTSIGSR